MTLTRTEKTRAQERRYAHVHTRFRSLFRGRSRIALAWVFAITLILATTHYPHPLGIVVCFLGATIRFWASGYLRKDSRPAVGGPYRWTRNPLYLGTWVMAVGTALAIQNFLFAAILSLVFAVLYHYVILDEETKLDEIFGAPYLKYKSCVPRFFPFPASSTQLLEVNPEPQAHAFDWQLALKTNQALEAYYSFAGLVGGITLIAWVRGWLLG